MSAPQKQTNCITSLYICIVHLKSKRTHSSIKLQFFSAIFFLVGTNRTAVFVTFFIGTYCAFMTEAGKHFYVTRTFMYIFSLCLL